MQFSPHEIAKKFSQSMRDSGVEPPSQIVQDGEIHRFGRKSESWYFLSKYGGVFGDWSKNIKVKFSLYKAFGVELSALEKMDYDLKVNQHLTKKLWEIRENSRLAIKRAGEVWKRGSGIGTSEYLERKKVKPYGIRFLDGKILVPIRNAYGSLTSIQYIFPDGKKMFEAGAPVKGSFHILGKLDPDHMYLCEGYATGATIHELTGSPVIVGFFAGNLEPVLEGLFEKYKRLKITIAADNDCHKANNVGIMVGKELAKKYNCDLVFPIFTNHSDDGTDFNDLRNVEGELIVRTQVSRRLGVIEADGIPLDKANREKKGISMIREKKAKAFPLDCLDSSWRNLIMSVSKLNGSPIELVFNSLFSAVNFIAASLANIELPWQDYRTKKQSSPLSLFFITKALSGERKTSVSFYALKKIREYEETLMTNYRKALEAYKQASFVYEGEKKSLHRSVKHEHKSMEEKLNYLKSLKKPIKPARPLFIVEDVTMEGIYKAFLEGYPNIFFNTSEGGNFLNGYSNTKANQIKTATILSTYWDGGIQTHVTRGNPISSIKNVRLCLHMAMQPSVFDAFFKSKSLRNQGLMSRFLVAHPETMMGKRTMGTRELLIETDAVVNTYWERQEEMLKLIKYLQNPNVDEEFEGSGMQLIQRCLHLGGDCLDALTTFYNFGETRVTHGEFFNEIPDAIAKSVDQVCRIAATFSLYHDPYANEVRVEDIKTAIELVSYYFSEQLKISHIEARITDALERDFYKYLLTTYSKEQTIIKRNVARNCPLRFRGEVNILFESLVLRGYLVQTQKQNHYLFTNLDIEDALEFPTNAA